MGSSNEAKTFFEEKVEQDGKLKVRKNVVLNYDSLMFKDFFFFSKLRSNEFVYFFKGEDHNLRKLASLKN